MNLTVTVFGRVLLEVSLTRPDPAVDADLGRSFESGSMVLTEINHAQTDEVSFGYETKRGGRNG